MFELLKNSLKKIIDNFDTRPFQREDWQKRFSENSFFLALIKGFLVYITKTITIDYLDILNLVVIFYMIIDICLTKKNDLSMSYLSDYGDERFNMYIYHFGVIMFLNRTQNNPNELLSLNNLNIISAIVLGLSLLGEF